MTGRDARATPLTQWPCTSGAFFCRDVIKIVVRFLLANVVTTTMYGDDEQFQHKYLLFPSSSRYKRASMSQCMSQTNKALAGLLSTSKRSAALHLAYAYRLPNKRYSSSGGQAQIIRDGDGGGRSGKAACVTRRTTWPARSLPRCKNIVNCYARRVVWNNCLHGGFNWCFSLFSK